MTMALAAPIEAAPQCSVAVLPAGRVVNDHAYVSGS